MPAMTSKGRIQAAIKHQDVDHLPLSFEGVGHGFVKFANDRFPDRFARALYFKELGVDCGVMVGFPFEPLPDAVNIREWEEKKPSSADIVLHKEYTTPSGKLCQVVRYTDDYPGRHIPLISDHNVPPTRSLRYLVEKPDDLDCLKHFLNPLHTGTVEEFRSSIKAARTFCDEHQLILSAYLSGVGDPLMWLSGVENVIWMALDDPDLLHQYIGILAQRQLKILEIALDAGVDHIVRRGWYESTDFWSPSLYREFLFVPLCQEVAMTHQAGATFDYVMASGSTPLLGMMVEAGIDLHSNIDPMARNTNLREIRETIGSKVALCGGINNFEVLEKKTEEEVRQAVLEAIEVFTPSNGCILAPSDSLYLGDPEIIERNFHVMIDTWKKTCWR